MTYGGRWVAVAGGLALLLFAEAKASAAETLKSIKDAGVLQVCMAEAYPMAVRNPANGEWSGYNISMAKDLAATLGVKLTIVDQTYATMIPALLGKKCDILMAPAFATPERAMVVAFTAPYSRLAEQAVVRQDSKVTEYSQLDAPGTIVTVAAGTSEEADAKKMWPKAQVKPIVSDNTYAFFLEVAAGRADAALGSSEEGKIFIQKNPQMKLKILEPDRVVNPVSRSYAVRPDDWHFLNFLNLWLDGAKDRYPQTQPK